MIRVSVITECPPRCLIVHAYSILDALDLAGGASTGARLHFPIEPGAFFVPTAGPCPPRGARRVRDTARAKALA